VPYIIEPAGIGDIEEIARFQEGIVEETEPHPIDLTPLRDGIRHVLENPSAGFYLVARTEEGVPAGCLMIQREWSDWRNAPIWWVHSVYVAREHRRRGVFHAMLACAESLAAREGAVGFRLLFDRGNAPAHSTYLKAGFTRCHYDVLEKMF
jgi:GNAT superfamily N-acetyltransferase